MSKKKKVLQFASDAVWRSEKRGLTYNFHHGVHNCKEEANGYEGWLHLGL